MVFGEIITSNDFFLPGSSYDGILGLAFEAIATVLHTRTHSRTH
jgi:hypothetical protein